MKITAPAMAKHNEFGKKGEQLAVDFLIENGYTILKRNYRFRKAELDILAINNDVLVVVEVKSRSGTIIMNPLDTVTTRKIQLLKMAANQYVIAHDLNVEVRFDIISVLKLKKGYKITHVANAFYHF